MYIDIFVKYIIYLYVFQNQVEKREFAKPLQSVSQQLEVFDITDNVHTVCLFYAVKTYTIVFKGLSHFKSVFDIYLTEFGADLTTVLPVLFKYCYKYCYSDSRKL